MIRWDGGEAYEIVFSTRLGGVSEGRFASLNLGRMTGDEVDRVDENRRRLCAEVGGTLGRLALNRQIHSHRVLRAVPGSRGNLGDGLWTDEPDLPILAFAADCLPIALVCSNGAEPAVAVVHAGWRGLLEGVIAASVSALTGGMAAAEPSLRACVGPALVIEPCTRFVSEVYSHGTTPRKPDSSCGLEKRSKLPTSAHSPAADSVSIPRKQRSRAIASA